MIIIIALQYDILLNYIIVESMIKQRNYYSIIRHFSKIGLTRLFPRFLINNIGTSNATYLICMCNR